MIHTHKELDPKLALEALAAALPLLRLVSPREGGILHPPGERKDSTKASPPTPKTYFSQLYEN